MSTEIKDCEFCGVTFTYERVKKYRKYCSKKCAHAYHQKFLRDRGEMRERVAEYYQQNPAKRFLAATKSSAKK